MDQRQHVVVRTLDWAGRRRRVSTEDQRGISPHSSRGRPRGLLSLDERDELAVHPVGQSGGRLTSENSFDTLRAEDVEEER